MALTKVINDLADLNQSGSTNALKGCAGTTAEQPASTSSIEYLIVGGGGMAMGDGSGGGGAGGLLTGTTTVHHGTPTVITVGEGAPAKSTGNKCCGPSPGNGSDSGFNGIRALGGGSAVWRFDTGAWLPYTQSNGGGSGSGGGQSQGGAGTESSLPGDGTSGQGLGGGATDSGASNIYATGGGGGAGTSVDNADGTGSTGTSGQSGNGGSGRDMQTFISNTNATTAGVGEVIASEVWFAGGGGGGGNAASTCGVGYSTLPGTGGKGGGGDGSNTSGTNGDDGQDNTGGGGGGGSACASGYGGAGGSGVVILKYDNTIITGYSTTGSLLTPSLTGSTSKCNFPTGVTGTALYEFENNADDSCTSGPYDGTFTNAAYGVGKFGSNCASFDGSTNYINVSTNSVFNAGDSGTGFSLSFWINRDTTTGVQVPLNKEGALSGNYGWDLRYTSGAGYAYTLYDISNNGYAVSTGANSTTGTWEYVAATYNTSDSKIRIYLDGILKDTSAAFASAAAPSPDAFYIGARNDQNYIVDGLMDQVRVYPTTLTDAQVTQLYNETESQTYFVDTPTSGTDTLVFKSGTGTISFTGDPAPGADVGMLRYNSTLGQMEHFNSGGWKDFTNV